MNGHRLALAGLVLVGLGAGAAQAAPFLQVDINGGNPANQLRPGAAGWSQWGGAADAANNPPLDPSPAVTSISHSYSTSGGNVNVTINAVGGAGTLNSRDRGNPNEPGGTAENNEITDGYVYRDFVYLATTGGNIQSVNHLRVEFAGLQANTDYTLALYSYDWTGGHTMNWTTTAPVTIGSRTGYIMSPNNTFVRPENTSSFTWTQNQSAGLVPMELDVTTDASGAFTVWGWGGNGVTGNQNADTTYLNGFAISAVPEPTSLALVSLAGCLMLRRRAQ